MWVWHVVIVYPAMFMELSRVVRTKALFLLLIVMNSDGALVSRKVPKAIIAKYEEVYPAIIHSSGEKPHPSELTVKIKVSGVNFTLVLSLNRHLLSSGFKSVHYNQHGDEVITESPANCFYHGFVVNYPKWTSTMATCQGMSGSFGDPSRVGQLYHVEPLTSGVALDYPHAVYSGAQLNSTKGTCGNNHKTNENITAVHSSVEKRMLRSKVPRQTANGELILELILVSDYRQYQTFNSSVPTVVMRALQIANFVDSIWKALGIRVVLVQAITWSNGDMINVVSDSSALLSSFQTYQSTVKTLRDSIMLITGITLNSNVVGLAYVGTMCGSSATAETQDGGRVLEETASTAAHELGHNLNMIHDDDQSRKQRCNCTDPITMNTCVMHSVLSNPAPTLWSDCSSQDLMAGLNPTTKNLGRCLTNTPNMTVGAPVCGNGIREGTEICDCGSIAECKDPCCNATSCQLKAGAQCGSGACCQSCHFIPYGTTCRNATNECDILEYCSGSSSQCPADVYIQNGRSCANGQAYCYYGACQTLDSQCKYFYGQSNGNGGKSCYNYNTRGDYFGNCGVTTVGYTPCSASNIYCGSLFCNATPSAQQNGPSHVSVPYQWAYTSPCISFTLTSATKAANPDYSNPGFVADGTICSNQSLCIQQRCVPVSSLGLMACPIGLNGTECSGNGLCNNLGTCSCNVKYTGGSCSSVYGAQTSTVATVATPTATVAMAAVDNSGAIIGAVVGTLLAVAIIVVVIVIVAIFVLRSRTSVTNNAPSKQQVSRKAPAVSVVVEMDQADTTAPSKPPSSARKPPPPPRPHAPPTNPSSETTKPNVAPPVASRPPPPNKEPPSRPKPTPAPRPGMVVGFKPAKPTVPSKQ